MRVRGEQDALVQPGTALGNQMRELAQDGFYPLLVGPAVNRWLVPLNARDVLCWVDDDQLLPAGQLVGFPCRLGRNGAGFSALERQRLAVVTQCYLAGGYIRSEMCSGHNGDRFYVDWVNDHAQQFSMGLTTTTGGSLESSLRLVFPAAMDYAIHDHDATGRPRTQQVREWEVPMHTLLGDASDRATRLAARYNVSVIGEVSQLASVVPQQPVLPFLLQLFATLARVLVTAPDRDSVFADGGAVAVAIATVPRLAGWLERAVNMKLVYPGAQVRLIRAGPPAWRLGSVEVPLLLTIQPDGSD
jgi:hypothetical protein